MRDRRLGDVHAGEAVHERRRSERGLSGQSAIHEQRVVAARDAQADRQFHEQVVRMLAVDQRRVTVRRLAGLEQQRVAVLPDGRGLGGQHRAQAQRRRAQWMLAHRHQHVVGVPLRVAARAALLVVHEVAQAVEHEHPVAAHDVDAVVLGCVGLPRGAGRLAPHCIGAIHAVHARPPSRPCPCPPCPYRTCRGAASSCPAARRARDFGHEPGSRREAAPDRGSSRMSWCEGSYPSDGWGWACYPPVTLGVETRVSCAGGGNDISNSRCSDTPPLVAFNASVSTVRPYRWIPRSWSTRAERRPDPLPARTAPTEGGHRVHPSGSFCPRTPCEYLRITARGRVRRPAARAGEQRWLQQEEHARAHGAHHPVGPRRRHVRPASLPRPGRACGGSLQVRRAVGARQARRVEPFAGHLPAWLHDPRHAGRASQQRRDPRLAVGTRLRGGDLELLEQRLRRARGHARVRRVAWHVRGSHRRAEAHLPVRPVAGRAHRLAADAASPRAL